jgi:hypothetical protein
VHRRQWRSDGPGACVRLSGWRSPLFASRGLLAQSLAVFRFTAWQGLPKIRGPVQDFTAREALISNRCACNLAKKKINKRTANDCASATAVSGKSFGGRQDRQSGAVDPDCGRHSINQSMIPALESFQFQVDRSRLCPLAMAAGTPSPSIHCLEAKQLSSSFRPVSPGAKRPVFVPYHPA